MTTYSLEYAAVWEISQRLKAGGTNAIFTVHNTDRQPQLCRTVSVYHSLGDLIGVVNFRILGQVSLYEFIRLRHGNTGAARVH